MHTKDTSTVARKMSGEFAKASIVPEHKRIPKLDKANLEISKVYALDSSSLLTSILVVDIFRNQNNNNFILAVSSEEEAIKAYKQLQFLIPDSNATKNEVLYFPSKESAVYDIASSSALTMAYRVSVLTQLAINLNKQDIQPQNNKILITNVCNLLSKLPMPHYFSNSCIKVHKGMKTTSSELCLFLINQGFTRSSIAVDSAHFAIRGEILDLVLLDHIGYRITFAWSAIESIKSYNVWDQISNCELEELLIFTTNEIILNPDTVKTFKANYLKNFGVKNSATSLYKSISEQKRFPGYESLLPLFYDQTCNLLDYLKAPKIIYNQVALDTIAEYETSIYEAYKTNQNITHHASFYPLLEPQEISYSATELCSIITHKDNIDIDDIEDIDDIDYIEKTNVNVHYKIISPQTYGISNIIETIKTNPKLLNVIFCSSLSNVDKVQSIMGSSYQYKIINRLVEAEIGCINITVTPLNSGFISDQYFFISEIGIIGVKQHKPKAQDSRQRLKNILIELDSFKEEQLVVHKEHGIGRFLCIENIEVGGSKHDCIKILYANNNRLYVPIENINLVKKYDVEDAELDALGSVSWQKRKSKIKNRIGEIAKTLLNIASKRELIKSKPINFEIKDYEHFCSKFPYIETEDQLNAINDIIDDLQSGRLMDRLICGDVGFGKTEVAIRAAYLVAKNLNELRPQVAIICPTTILCRQHYLRFIDRFRHTQLNIAELSSLKKAAEIKQIKQDIKLGSINIVIGTQALLNKEIKFHNLQLAIIDEEQHFGVQQKEILKNIKSDIHVLAMSATPIPRTLQMSMLGIKCLSLIATPPIDRIPVRTMIVPLDLSILHDALLKEQMRGGQSFYVCPRISDIEQIEQSLIKITPNLKYKTIHGGMKSEMIENAMLDFDQKKFDVLISTNIIESGIDISNANTIIIHNADLFGMSQLYQLKGRVGRGKIKGYAYLVLTKKSVNKSALERMEIIQNADQLGAGFNIASYDMDFRGFGNLVGEEQSGQIKEVGFELYQDMLEAEIKNLRDNHANNSTVINTEITPNINLRLPMFIDDKYIEDANLRFGIYRRIGELSSIEDVENFQSEMKDRFGQLPNSFSNLLDVVKIKQICITLGIESLDSGPQGFVLRFNTNTKIRDQVLHFLHTHPSKAKLTQDSKLIYLVGLNQVNIIKETHNLLTLLSNTKSQS